MGKFFFRIRITVSLVLTLAGIASQIIVPPEDIPTVHTHQWIEESYIAPTCEKEGIVTYYCIGTGKCELGRTKREIFPKIAHTIVTDPAIAPDCETSGKTEGSHCIVCNTVITKPQSIAPLGHDYSIQHCDDFSHWTECSVCGKASQKTNHSFSSGSCDEPLQCDNCDYVKPAGQHCYGEYTEITAANCYEKGSEHAFCNICGHEDIREIEFKGHSFSELKNSIVSIIKSPTNTEDGKAIAYCSECKSNIEISIPKLSIENYIVVPYIESSGNEYLDSEINMEKTDSVIYTVDMQFIEQRDNDWAGANGFLQFYYPYIGHCDRTLLSIAYNLDGKFNEEISDNGSIIKTLNWSHWNYTNTKIGFFSLGDHNNGWWANAQYCLRARLYGANIIKNGKVAGCFIPVINTQNGQNGLLNIIADSFITNEGNTGNFILPEGYKSTIDKAPTNTEEGLITISYPGLKKDLSVAIPKIDSTQFMVVPCIESSGREYIDTGLITSYNDAVLYSLDYQLLSDNPDAWTGACWLAEFAYGRGINHLNRSIVDVYYNMNADHMQYCYSDGHLSYSLDITPQILKNVRIGIFRLGNPNGTWWGAINNVQKARCFGGHIDINGKQAAYYIPVLNVKTNEAGLYDVVSKRFLGNKSPFGRFTIPDPSNRSLSGKERISDFTILDKITFDGDYYLTLNETINEYFEVKAKAYDGKAVQPVYYDNGYRLGMNNHPYYSKVYDLYELTSYYDGSVLHHYVPVMKKADQSIGLYDTVCNKFYPLSTDSAGSVSEYFFMNPNEYHQEIAELTTLAAAQRIDYLTLLTKWQGFEPVLEYNGEGQDENDIHKVHYTLHKKTKLKDGELYNLYMLYVLPTNGNNEWASNFTMGENLNGFHEGFEKGADFVLENINGCIDNDPIHNKIIICSYSRGAAVASIVAAKLMDQAGKFSSDNLYLYAIACPNYSTRNKQYTNLFQICNVGDLVTQVPLTSWGYKKEGVVIYLPNDSDSIEQLNASLRSYQWQNKLPVVGYTGFTEDISSQTNQLSLFISKESASNPDNPRIITNIFNTIYGDEKLDLNALTKFLSNVKLIDDIKTECNLARFLITSKDKNIPSHEAITYQYWVKIMHNK